MAEADFNRTECLDTCLVTRALDGLAVALILMSPSGRVLWLNRMAADILGQHKEECIGQAFNQLLRDPQLSAFWHEACRSDDGLLRAVSIRWPKPVDLKMNSVNCCDPDGTKIGQAIVCCDLTREMTVQMELSQAVAAKLLTLVDHTREKGDRNGALTAQELKILRLVGEGKGNSEIAEKTHITQATVRSHLKNIYRKLNLTSRTAAVSYAIRNDLVL